MKPDVVGVNFMEQSNVFYSSVNTKHCELLVVTNPSYGATCLSLEREKRSSRLLGISGGFAGKLCREYWIKNIIRRIKNLKIGINASGSNIASKCPLVSGRTGIRLPLYIGFFIENRITLKLRQHYEIESNVCQNYLAFTLSRFMYINASGREKIERKRKGRFILKV